MLYFENEDMDNTLDKDGNKELKTHYCLIKDMSKILGSQIDKHKGKKYICLSYLNNHTS